MRIGKVSPSQKLARTLGQINFLVDCRSLNVLPTFILNKTAQLAKEEGRRRNQRITTQVAKLQRTILTLLLVGFLEYVNWWGGRFGPPFRSRELTGRFRWDKRHSIALIVNFQNHYKKSKKVENWRSWKQKFPKISGFSPNY